MTDLRTLRALPPLWGGIIESGGGGDETESDTGVQPDTKAGRGGTPDVGLSGGDYGPSVGGPGFGGGTGGLGAGSGSLLEPLTSADPGAGPLDRMGAGRDTWTGLDAILPAIAAGAGGGPSTSTAAPWADPYAALAASLGLDTGTGTGSTGMAGGPSGAMGGSTAGGTSILDNLLKQASTYIPYLESTDLPKTTEGQAIMGSAYAPIDTAYQTAKQELEQTLGPRQGASGILADEEAKLAQQQAAQKAAVQRDFASSYTQRGQSALDDLSALNQQEQAAKAAGLGIEQGLGETQIRDLMDLATIVSGGVPAASSAANIGSGLLSFAGQENAAANAEMEAANQGLAGLATSLGFGGIGTRTPVSTTTSSPQTTSPTDTAGLEALLLGNPSQWRGGLVA